MDLEKKNILIAGLGVTGMALARFLKAKGACLTATDTATEEELGDAISRVKQMGIRLVLGSHRTEIFTEADLIVLSPGVPQTLPSLSAAKEKGIPILGEIELASRFIREPIIAVSGTNGKTTTTALLGEMLRSSGYKVFVGGNIGTPLIHYVEKKEKDQMIVAEISSFQLDTIETFQPKIGVLLNITEDHLDRYADFNAYATSKGRLFENQRKEDTAVLNGADARIRRLSKTIQSKKWFFNATSKTETGAVMDTDKIYFNLPDAKNLFIERSGINLWGRYNAENVAAAGLAALAAGGDFGGIQAAVAHFKGLPHRMEYIATKHNVRYINDSKATNIDAVKQALTTFEEPVILIMGGRDKGGNFKILNEPIRQHIKQLVLMGEAADQIATAVSDATATDRVITMKQAIRCAQKAARSGDVILLSPGCTSFDQYRNFEERGDDFRRIVLDL